MPGAAHRLITRHWRRLVAGFSVMGTPGLVARAVGWSAVAWIFAVVGCWAVIEAVSPGAPLVGAAFAVAAISTGIATPSSPGFIGVFEFVGQQALAVPFPDRFSPLSA